MPKKHDLHPAQVEAWLDDNQPFVINYFLQKATQPLINSWLAERVVKIATTDEKSPIKENGFEEVDARRRTRSDVELYSGRRTPIHKISNEEIKPQYLPLKAMVSTDETGSPSFYTPPGGHSPNLPGKKFSVINQPSAMRRISQKKLYNDKTSEENHCNSAVCLREKGRRLSPVDDERDMIMELVRDIAMDLDVTSVSHRILQNVSILLEADRCSLFLMKKRDGEKFLVSRLFDVSRDTSLEDSVVVKNEIRIEVGQGIAGMVALDGNTLNIPDAYQDDRFNKTVDRKTGYKTRSILCMPIRDGMNEIVGVAQVINKSVGAFTEKDEKIFASYLGFCGIAIHNAQLFEKLQLENRRNEVLLDLARVLFEEQSSLSVLMDTILTHTTSLLGSERSSILLTDSNQANQAENVFTQTFEHVSDDVKLAEKLGGLNNNGPMTSRKVPFNLPVTSYVRLTGQKVNIADVSTDKRFNIQDDNEFGFQTKALLCIPIRDSLRQVIGVIQLINKEEKFGSSFSQSDEQILEAFAIFCGLGISNSRNYEETAKLAAKQQVVLEVLSYHAVSSPSESSQISNGEIRSAKTYDLLRYEFDDSTLSDLDTLKASVRMFIDLNLIEKFHINIESLCRWVSSVKRNYREVAYHNWRHAFNVCQSAFCMIKTGKLSTIFDDFEQLALLVACLSHDLDHRGTNNAFQTKIEHPLARLYSTSTLEYHHYNQCLMLLQSEGCEILSQLSSADYAHVVKLIQHAILSTDLAIYFQRRQSFFDVVNGKKNDWKNDAHRELLRSVVLTGCDVAPITKPWSKQKKVALQVAEEFFEQGDIEKNCLHEQPIDMMNRQLKHKLPAMQVGFIDGICMPLYKTLTAVSPLLQPMLEGCTTNRKNWVDLAEKTPTGTTL